MELLAWDGMVLGVKEEMAEAHALMGIKVINKD